MINLSHKFVGQPKIRLKQLAYPPGSSQGVGSGACAASVLVKDGELHVANVGDCRVVLSRNGVATALTKQHRVCREDERLRIEKSVSERK